MVHTVSEWGIAEIANTKQPSRESTLKLTLFYYYSYIDILSLPFRNLFKAYVKEEDDNNSTRRFTIANLLPEL